MTIPDEIYLKMGMTPPDTLDAMLDLMEEEQPGPDVADYANIIVRLHDEKGMSFRAITAFLDSHGVKTNRTTVHELYCETIQEAEDGLGDEDIQPPAHRKPPITEPS